MAEQENKIKIYCEIVNRELFGYFKEMMTRNKEEGKKETNRESKKKERKKSSSQKKERKTKERKTE